MDAQGTAPQLTLGGDVRMSSFGLESKVKDRTVTEMNEELRSGGKFVMYPYCISLLIVTIRKRSRITWAPPGQSRVKGGIPYALISFVAGWWGFPFGFIFTPIYIVRSLAGGMDVTAEVVGLMNNGQLGPNGQHQLASTAQPATPPPAVAPPQPPAGWHPDPHGQARLRYYDGNAWTAHTSA